MIIKIKNEKSFIWNDKLLYILDLPNKKYSYQDIEDSLKKKYYKKGHIEISDNNVWKTLQLPSWKRKIRLSYIMSHIIKNFIIENERPKTKYYSFDYDFSYLDNKEIKQMIKIL